jgi:hypothetical protein
VNELTLKLILCLLAAHFSGDFLLQTDDDVIRKRSPSILLKHTLILTVLSYIFCGLWTRWEIPLTIFVTHTIIDFIKVRVRGREAPVFILDQVVHITIIVLLSWALVARRIGISRPYWELLFGDAYYQIMTVLSGAILTVAVGAILIGYYVRPFLTQLEQAKEAITPRSGKPIHALSRGFENGGQTIGQLERALIFLFILANQPAAIGFLVAAKSVFRFGELRDKENRMEAEYIIIGTLMSFLYGMCFSYLTRHILHFF